MQAYGGNLMLRQVIACDKGADSFAVEIAEPGVEATQLVDGSGRVESRPAQFPLQIGRVGGMVVGQNLHRAVLAGKAGGHAVQTVQAGAAHAADVEGVRGIRCVGGHAQGWSEGLLSRRASSCSRARSSSAS